MHKSNSFRNTKGGGTSVSGINALASKGSKGAVPQASVRTGSHVSSAKLKPNEKPKNLPRVKSLKVSHLTKK